jgi:hypothetical protein
MTNQSPPEPNPNARLRLDAANLITKLRGKVDQDTVGTAKTLMSELKERREFPILARVAEEVSRHEPHNPKIRRLYAQSLIETGRATAAIDVLRVLAQSTGKANPEWAEARGLLGRAYKQIFFDSSDKESSAAQEALRRAIEHYRAPFKEDPVGHCWHGVNLVALLHKARALGARFARDLDPKQLAQQIILTLDQTPEEQRDNWYHSTAAEAHLALSQWDEVKYHIRAYVQDERTTAFNLGSTLRQFTEVWDLDAKQGSDDGRVIVAALRARTLAAAAERPPRPDEPGGFVELDADQMQRAVHEPEPPALQLQAILGVNGPKTYRWWRTGLERARGIASFRLELFGRFGTGFLVRGGDLVPSFGDEPMVLTNWHVVNSQGAANAAPPDAVEVLFEAEDQEKGYRVKEVVWSSPVDLHDAILLRLAEPPRTLPAIPFARALPDLTTSKPRVYVIGHPGGRELSFSFQDNELLDHEGPPRGTPPISAVCRLHYRAPTEPGSSGSPVFNGSEWKVLALHHAGGRDIPRLNGLTERWDANEGVSIDCIAVAMREDPKVKQQASG